MPRGTTRAIGVDCAKHGLTDGHHDSLGNARCTCGRFAAVTDEYCGKHGVDLSLLTGHSDCPKCLEEERIAAERRERDRRRADPNMHNSVDAQANAIDHSRSPQDFL